MSEQKDFADVKNMSGQDIPNASIPESSQIIDDGEIDDEEFFFEEDNISVPEWVSKTYLFKHYQVTEL